MKIFVFELFLCLLNLLCIVNCINYDISSGSFDDLNIVLSPNRLNASDCPEILKNLKVSCPINLLRYLRKFVKSLLMDGHKCQICRERYSLNMQCERLIYVHM